MRRYQSLADASFAREGSRQLSRLLDLDRSSIQTAHSVELENPEESNSIPRGQIAKVHLRILKPPDHRSTSWL